MMNSSDIESARPKAPDVSSFESCVGFAIVDAAACIISANAEFLNLLKLSSEKTTTPVSRLLVSTFPEKSDEITSALASGAPAQLCVSESSTGQSIKLHLDALRNGQRMIIAESLSVESAERDHCQKSTIDPLTQLGNQQLLIHTIDQWAASSSSKLTQGAVLMDLDRFKQVNITLGYSTGDALLKLVAKRVKRSARSDDVVVRMGSDKFIVLVRLENGTAEAVNIAKRLVDLMSRPFPVDGHQIMIGASVGIATLENGTEDVKDLINHAEMALQQAKESGRGTYRMFEPQIENQAQDRRSLEIRLRRALSQKEFELYYQPQVDLNTEKLTGYEALLRWNDADLGQVPPARFIGLAEEIGEIFNIGDWVLRTACAEAMRWPDHLGVAVNISPVQFTSPRFLESVHKALESTGLKPSRLEIEIPENGLLNNIDSVRDKLWTLQHMGVQIVIDDFGSGYSSLSRLSDFPFSKIKIDQSFVRGKDSRKSHILAEAIVSIAKCLGVRTLAEGVETDAQYRRYSEGGCIQAQGYLIGKSMPVGELQNFTSMNNKKIQAG